MTGRGFANGKNAAKCRNDGEQAVIDAKAGLPIKLDVDEPLTVGTDLHARLGDVYT